MSSSSIREELAAAILVFVDPAFSFVEVRVLRGIVACVVDRRAYDVLWRLEDDAVVSSSSDGGSGAARFLPLGSEAGSLMVKGVEEDNVPLRVRLVARETVS